MARGMSVRSAEERVSVEPAAKVLLVDDDLRDLKYYGAILRHRGPGWSQFRGTVGARARDRNRPTQARSRADTTPGYALLPGRHAARRGGLPPEARTPRGPRLGRGDPSARQGVVAQEPKGLNSWYKRVK